MDALETDITHLLTHLWSANVLTDAKVESTARELLLDTLGSAISALGDPTIQELFGELHAAEPGHLPFPGTSLKFSAGMYLLAFSAAVCHYEAGEGLPLSHGRPGLHAIPALLAYGLPRGRSLRDLLEALVIAYEVGGRLGSVFRIKPGMHVDGTWGSFASSVGLARLEGLDPGKALDALNHVACHMPYSLYYPIKEGSLARNLYIGHGAFLGASSVRAARAGYGGPLGSLSENLRLVLNRENAPLLAEYPVEQRILHRGYLKKYPCTRHMHYGIEAARRYVETAGPLSDLPDRVLLKIYPEAIKYCPNRAPQAHIQAQFSLSYGLAYALLHGNFTPAAYSPNALQDPRLRALESRIVIEEDARLVGTEERGCTLEVVSAGRRDGPVEVRRLSGDIGMKMPTQEVRDKFRSLTEPVLGKEVAEKFIQSILLGRLDESLSLPVSKSIVLG